ncbi:Apolipoprotein D-like 7 [Homarus americanus]|uniref:Apolipoprotein D-like 7 n=1 Tax=Homarus americanus TaxID=6706 RepID=A0A8J5K1V1_HOMAM|nr:Apolipoprotein D-like 7 [Homarus americanus]
MKASLLVSLALVAVAHAGTCPKYPIIRDFDFHRYMGLWYQQDKLQASWEAPGRCWKTLYSRDLMEDEYQVLATDYESFSLEYKCDPNGLLEKSAYAIMHHLGVDIRKLERVDQTCGGIDIGGSLSSVDYDYYSTGPQVLTDNRRFQPHQAQEFYQYDDYYEPAGGFQSASAVPVPQPSESPSNQFAVSFPVQDTDSNIRRRPRPPQRKPNLKRQSIPTDERISLGQSLATRLWHVLHSPVRK